MVTCNDMVPMTLELVESEGSGVRAAGRIKMLCEHGMEASLESAPAKRFAWLEFGLPGDGATHRIKALGEVVDVRDEGDTTKNVVFRFKHLFPSDRSALAQYLARRAA